MEEQPDQVDLSNNQETLKDHIVNNTESEIIHSDNVKKEESKSDEKVVKTASKQKEEAASTSRNSPDPSCAICLGQLTNKSFTDSCFHMFCFTCLLEWSKVKAECPLCKQKFKSIVHNVRSIEDYDQYYVNNKTSENYWNSFNESQYRFSNSNRVMNIELVRNSPNSFESPSSNRLRNAPNSLENQITSRRLRNAPSSFESQITSHRLRYAPHSVRTSPLSQSSSIGASFVRRHIYDSNLWVIPSSITKGQVRQASPIFYAENTACTHRLIPWLHRELFTLLRNNESQVTFVMELIVSLILRYSIQSQEFYVHIQPYLAQHTEHFIHEFYSFAISPFDIDNYDRHARYNRRSYATFSSFNNNDSISETVPIGVPSTSGTKSNSKSLRKSKRAFKTLKKLILKRNSITDSYSIIPEVRSNRNPLTLLAEAAEMNSSSNIYVAGPSTSGIQQRLTPLSDEHLPSIAEIRVSDESESDNDDCQIIEEIKPKSQRTPEVIDLLSDDDDEPDNQQGALSDSSSIEYICSTGENVKSPSITTDSRNENIDVEVLTNDIIIEFPPSTSNNQNSFMNNLENRPDYQINPPLLLEYPKFDLTIVPQNSLSEQKNEWNTLSSNSSLEIFNSNTYYPLSDASTDSYSETENSDHASKKKIKLASVAKVVNKTSKSHDSNHSSHKKKKEKKKKKKKHSHKRKYRIISDSD